MQTICTLCCLVDIKKHSFLTSCVFWFNFLNASSHLCLIFFFNTQSTTKVIWGRLKHLIQWYMDHVTIVKVRYRIPHAIGRHGDLLIKVKRQALKWYGYVSRLFGLEKHSQIDRCFTPSQPRNVISGRNKMYSYQKQNFDSLLMTYSTNKHQKRLGKKKPNE